MKLLVISDIHGNSEALDKIPSEDWMASKAVLFAGDAADAIKDLDGEQVLQKLLQKHNNIFAVLGNHDSPSFIKRLDEEQVNIEGLVASLEGVVITGSGGSTPFMRDTPNERSEDEVLSDLDAVKSMSEAELANLIIISHNPPKDTLCDKTSSGFHAGSGKFRALIETYQPLAVITGHIHEAASIDKIGSTVILNSGAFGIEGTYAILDISVTDGNCKIVNIETKKVE